MDTARNEIRDLTDEEMKAATGAAYQLCHYEGANKWEQWISDYFGVGLVPGRLPLSTG